MCLSEKGRKMNNLELIRLLANEIKDIEIQVGFKLFLDHKKQNNRIDTYNYYKKHIKVLLVFFSNEKISFFQNITNFHIGQLKDYLKNKDVKNVTINKFLQVLKCTINFLVDNDLITKPNLKIDKLKESKPELNIIDMNTAIKIIKYIFNEELKIQFRVAILLILTTGIRRTELIHIKTVNIHIEDSKIYLDRTKTGNSRYIYLVNEIKPLIQELLNERKDSTYLFLDKDGNQASQYMVDRYFRKLKKDLDIKNLSPHMLRHFYATILINNNTDINTVRLLMGHETISMTLRYIDTLNEKLKQANQENNPINILK